LKFTKEDCEKLVKEASEKAADSRSREELQKNHEQFVLKALGMFQLLEFALKQYIKTYCKVELNEILSDEYLNDLPLGILKKRIKNKLGDHELASQIDELLPIRNDIAHQSLIEMIGHYPFEKEKYFSKGIAALPTLWRIEEVLLQVKNKVQILYKNVT
jgi:hypothetical protein